MPNDTRSTWAKTSVIHQCASYRITYDGPKEILNGHVIVSFAPVDFPFDAQQGWGSRSFTKRCIPHVCVFHRHEDWHQNPDFLPAMRAIRNAFSREVDLIAYGFSMGGFAALLAARTLQSSQAIAVSPQVSIDPETVPFERRYFEQWNKMGPWMTHLSDEMDDQRAYLILYDPLHKKDRKHINLLPKQGGSHHILIHGGGHAIIQTLVEAGLSEVLFDFLNLKETPRGLRSSFRASRHMSFRYVRRLGNLSFQKNSKAKHQFYDLAVKNGYRRLIKKWQPLTKKFA